MTSVLRRYDQIPARTKYLIAITSFDAFSADPDVYGSYILSDVSGAAFALLPGYSFGSATQIADTTFSQIGATPIIINDHDMYTDLGRSLYVYDTLGAGANLKCVFRQVTKNFNFTTEGINTSTIFWVKVWSAESITGGSGRYDRDVFVARTG